MPVIPILETITAIANLVTKTLPSDEERLQRLKLNHPRIYARIRKHLLIQAYRYLKHHRYVGVKEYLNFVNGDLSPAERGEAEKIILSLLAKNKK